MTELTLRSRSGWGGLWGRLIGRPNSGPATTTLRETVGETTGSSVTAQRPVTIQDALKATAVLAAVRVLSQGVAQVRKTVVKVTYDKTRGREQTTLLPDDPLWRLLCERPNDWQTPFEFWEALTIQAILRGNGYAYYNRFGSGELIVLDSADVQVLQVENSKPSYEIRRGGNIVKEVPFADILHLRGPNIGGVLGLDVMGLAAETIGMSGVAERAHGESIRRHGRLDGIISTPGEMTPPQVQAQAEQIKALFGPGGRGGVAFLDLGAAFQKLNMTPQELQMIENRRFIVEEVGRALGVYSQLLNYSETSSYASVEQVFLAHGVHSVEPWFVRVEQAVKRDVIGWDSTNARKQFRLDRESLLRASVKDTAEYIRTLVTMGVLTPNEARVMLGKNALDLPGADEPMTQLNMRPGYHNPDPVANPVQEAGNGTDRNQVSPQ